MDNSQKLGALGAVGAAIGAVAVFVLLSWTFRPTLTGGIPGPASGIDHVLWQVLVLAMIVPAVLVALLALGFAGQFRRGRGEG